MHNFCFLPDRVFFHLPEMVTLIPSNEPLIGFNRFIKIKGISTFKLGTIFSLELVCIKIRIQVVINLATIKLLCSFRFSIFFESNTVKKVRKIKKGPLRWNSQ